MGYDDAPMVISAVLADDGLMCQIQVGPPPVMCLTGCIRAALASSGRGYVMICSRRFTNFATPAATKCASVCAKLKVWS